MFGPDYSLCDDKDNMAGVVECVAAKTKAWNDRLNKAYKELPQRLDAGQGELLRHATPLDRRWPKLDWPAAIKVFPRR